MTPLHSKEYSNVFHLLSLLILSPENNSPKLISKVFKSLSMAEDQDLLPLRPKYTNSPMPKIINKYGLTKASCHQRIKNFEHLSHSLLK